MHFLDQLLASTKMINHPKMFAKLCSDRLLMTVAHQSEDGDGHVDRNDSLLTTRKNVGHLLSEVKGIIFLRFASLIVHKILHAYKKEHYLLTYFMEQSPS